MTVHLRKASFDDCQFFHELRTFPAYQKYFYSDSPNSYELHSEWFHRKIASSHHIYVVAELEDNYIGYVRFEPLSYPHIFEIGFIMHPNYLGKGLSYEMLVKALDFLAHEVNCPRPLVFASVLQSNVASLKTLQNVGFSTATPDSLSLSAPFNLERSGSALLFYKC